MRSKSTQGLKKVSPNKQSSTSVSSVKKSQHSKHRRKSSSSSYSSDESLDKEKVDKTHSNVPKTNTSETNKTFEPVTKPSETPKSPKTNESNKHSSEKSQRSSSSRHGHRKSGSHNDEDSRNSSRSSRHRSRSDEYARGRKSEDKDDKTNKGKSKSKHRSKSEKQPQIQDVQDKTESEISENVQVTPQSPQANIEMPVDNDTKHDDNESTAPLHESSEISTVDDSTKQNNNDDFVDLKQYKECKRDDSDDVLHNVEDREVTSETEVSKIEEMIEWQSVEHEVVVEEVPLQGDSEVIDYQEVLQVETNVIESGSNGTFELVGISETRSKSSSPEAGGTELLEGDFNCQTSKILDLGTSQITDQENAPQLNNVTVADDSSNAGGIQHHSDEDSRSIDAIVLHENSSTPPRDSKFNLTESYSADVRDIVDVNNDIQRMKDGVKDMFETPPKIERKHKWGNSLAGLKLIKPSMKNITIETIKEFCPNVVFLEENEIRLAAEHREKKVDRRISIEYKSDEDSVRRYDTQSSHEEVNSETDNSNIIAMNRKISIVEDTASKLRPPPSPARNPVSPILYITNLVRPFTLKQLKELLERTGRIRENGFWTDRIKSKCFVHYESSEDAEATRNALHGVNWPIGNGKQLIIEYSTPEEFEKARNPAPTPAALEKPPIIEKENIDKQVSVKRARHEEPEKVHKERERHRSEGRTREWEPPKDEKRGRRSRSRRHSRNREVRRDSVERNDRRRNRRTVTPPDYRSKKQKIKEEEPQKLMDDLFHKTKAVPSVYWLPLTPEEIATKQQERLLRMAEHKRRIEESSRNRGDHGRGAPHRRRYD